MDQDQPYRRIEDIVKDEVEQPTKYPVATLLVPDTHGHAQELNQFYQGLVQALTRVVGQYAPMMAMQLEIDEREGKAALVVALEQLLAATIASTCNASKQRHETLDHQLNRVIRRFSRNTIEIPKNKLLVPDVQTPLQPDPPE